MSWWCCSRTGHSTTCWGTSMAPRMARAFDGVIGKELTNPNPQWAEHGADRKVVSYMVATDMDSPNPDSGEECYHTDTQLFNTLDKHNGFKIGEGVTAPGTHPHRVRRRAWTGSSRTTSARSSERSGASGSGRLGSLALEQTVGVISTGPSRPRRNTYMTSRTYSKVLRGTPGNSVSAAERPDLQVRLALTRRRSAVRDPQRPPEIGTRYGTLTTTVFGSARRSRLRKKAVWPWRRCSHHRVTRNSGITTVTTVSARAVYRRISSRSGGPRSRNGRLDERQRHVVSRIPPFVRDVRDHLRDRPRSTALQRCADPSPRA